MYLPLDICREILLWLPAKSLLRFRSVCKEWRSVIDDPRFSRAHSFDYHLSSPSSHTTLVIKTKRDAHLFTFDSDASNRFTDRAVSGWSLGLTHQEWRTHLPRLPVSACNGLLLVYPYYLRKPQFEIWNPTTHERLQLPPIESNLLCPTVLLYGLGYDHAAQDLKAVAMSRQQTHVYSLRSDAWTTTIGDCLGISTDTPLWAMECHGVFLCGALHWLFNKNMIVALDVGTGKIRHIHLVSLVPETLVVNRKIDVVGGCLAVSAYSTCHPQLFQVWVMKGYGSDDESWVKLLSANRVAPTYSYHVGLRPVAYFKDKNQVLLVDGRASGFFLFDVESDSMKRVCFRGFNGDQYAQIIPRSIFRLRDHCGGGGGGTSTIIPLRPPRKSRHNLRTYSC